MTHSRLILTTLTLLALAACQRTPREAAPLPLAPGPASDPHAAMPASHDPHAGLAMPGAAPGAPAAASIAWDDPPGWQRVTPASPMRRAQYRIPHAPGESGDGELTVITFGPGQGGAVDANLERWYGQLAQPDGRATREIAQRRTMTVGSMNVTIAEATGRLAGGSMMTGVPPSPSAEHGRLLAAIVETADGPWFFKMTGPDRTVADARPAFEAMLRSLRPAAH